MSEENFYCKKCLYGTYSLNMSNDTSCKICQENAHCPGGNLILANSEFW